ncbi:ISL3 family transposase [Deinococcus peraridilitoris]|uniref:Transposase family protein n=1 Tax=Deinococcus peraridilitoris (strain DSM 19664 / LMG 22246 / CIP 109416 / KR-200) TaxID=937777 RepID=L0A882_DEIPD|nr:ISL3 family transposase [Deinococcus peraridilitoris]AFZ69392.1 transposase family protein [Deinococcus peraridilitoris DSM 19664]
MNALLLPPTLSIDRSYQHHGGLLLHLHGTSTQVCCPACGQPSHHIHSHYTRAPDDAPLGEQRVKWLLHVRRFRCLNPNCARQTFAEPWPELLKPHAQRTTRLQAAQTSVALALGGEASARLLIQLRMPTSPDSLLRAIRAQPLPEFNTPRVLGVDDFSFRKGKTFGALLVDLEQHCVIDVLKDRSAETLATWLQAHPGVEIVSRDRSPEFARGIAAGAPNAKQIADRWHLLSNLGTAVEHWLSRHRRSLLVREENAPSLPLPNPNDGAEAQKATDNWYMRHQQSVFERRAERLAKYEHAVELYEQGFSYRSIARQVGLSRSTITVWLALGHFPERKKPLADLSAFVPYIVERWDTPDLQVNQLCNELEERGYQGSRTSVYIAVQWLKRGVLEYSGYAEPAVPESKLAGLYTPRQGMWMFVRDAPKLSESEARRLALLHENIPVSVGVYDLAQRFVELVHQQGEDHAQRFAAWLSDAKASVASELRRFAKGLAADYDAVLAAFTEPWSNGQTEGQVTRLKYLKRQMYGRAKFDLLRARVLLA